MRLAAKYGLPIICLIDTPGAYPGIGAEERGQSEAIAENMYEMSRLAAPIICVVIGEGGSGGALGIGVGDRVAMLQHSYYSVISPEGCAGILWKSGEFAEDAARALRFTSKDLLQFGIVDHVIEEPLGHREPTRRWRPAVLVCRSIGRNRRGDNREAQGPGGSLDWIAVSSRRRPPSQFPDARPLPGSAAALLGEALRVARRATNGSERERATGPEPCCNGVLVSRARFNAGSPQRPIMSVMFG
jgi:hypothetical protein